MGAGLGSGRKCRFGNIEKLRQSEVEVLKALMNWNHTARKSDYRSIAAKCGIASSTVSAALYHLGGRGIVRRSQGRSWFIVPTIKDDIIQEFGQTLTSEVSEQAQHKPAENNPDPSHPA